MSKLKASFDNPSEGWIMLTIDSEGYEIDLVASYIYDFFPILIRALLKLREEQGKSIITLLGEPEEFDLQFTRVGSEIKLNVERFPDQQRNKQQAKNLFSFSGSYIDVCVPFWRALRSLQGRFSEKELEIRWKHPFPTRELDLLTATVRAKNQTED